MDTFRIAESLFSDAKSLNLGSLLESFGKSFESAHRALADTEATVVLFEHCIEHMKNLGEEGNIILSYLSAAVSDDSSLSYVLKYAGFPRKDVALEDMGKLILSRRKSIPELAFFHDETLNASWKDILKK